MTPLVAPDVSDCERNGAWGEGGPEKGGAQAHGAAEVIILSNSAGPGLCADEQRCAERAGLAPHSPAAPCSCRNRTPCRDSCSRPDCSSLGGRGASGQVPLTEKAGFPLTI